MCCRATGLILIDPGLKRYVPAILDQMKRDGLDPDDIKLVMTRMPTPIILTASPTLWTAPFR